MKKNNPKKVKKRKINYKRYLIFFLFLYLLINFFIQLINKPIKHIFITGNNLISDHNIILNAKLKNYPSIFTLNSKSVTNNILKNKLIESVNLTKKIDGTLIIEIKEKKPLFYKKDTNKVTIDVDLEIELEEIYGLPMLVNYIPNTINKEFISNFKKINSNIIAMMNYIEYQPSKNEDEEIVDDKRFLIMMNDGNKIYTTPTRLENLNYYLDILSNLNGKKGVLNLDSGNYFMPY